MPGGLENAFMLAMGRVFFPDYQTRGLAFMGFATAVFLALPIGMALWSTPSAIADRSWAAVVPGFMFLGLLILLEIWVIRASLTSKRHARAQQARPTEGFYLLSHCLTFEVKPYSCADRQAPRFRFPRSISSRLRTRVRRCIASWVRASTEPGERCSLSNFTSG